MAKRRKKGGKKKKKKKKKKYVKFPKRLEKQKKTVSEQSQNELELIEDGIPYPILEDENK